MPCDPSSQARQLHQEGPSRYLGKVVLSRRALARSSYPTMQAPRHEVHGWAANKRRREGCAYNHTCAGGRGGGGGRGGTVLMPGACENVYKI